MNVLKKILVVLIAMLFFGSLIVPNIGGAESRAFPDFAPDASITVALEQTNMDGSGNYAVIARTVTVTVENTGDVKLINMTLNCNITKGGVTYLNETNTTFAMKLDIGASKDIPFVFDNLTGGAGTYTIKATFMAKTFNNDSVVGPLTGQIIVTYLNVANKVAINSFVLWNKTMEMTPAYSGDYSLFMSNQADTMDGYENYTIHFKLANDGNMIITEDPIWVNVSVYDGDETATIGDRIWNDTTTVTGGIGLTSPKMVDYDTYFDLNTTNMTTKKFVNITVKSEDTLNIDTYFNYWINYNDIWNVEVTELDDYEAGGSYENFSAKSSPLTVTLTNTGNWNLTDITPFSVTLTITNDSGPWNQVVNLVAADLKDVHPGDPISVPFDMATHADLWEQGINYTMNVTITPGDEFNNTGANDNSIEFNVTLDADVPNPSYTFEVTEPLPGMYDTNELNLIDIETTITNTGNEDLFTSGSYYINASYYNLDNTADMYMNLTNKDSTGPILENDDEVISVGGWDSSINYNADFMLNVTLSTVLNGPPIAYDSVYVSLRGGVETGIITGEVTGATHGHVVVTADGPARALYMATTTGDPMTYTFVDMPATSGGESYTISILEADNYWYDEEEITSVMAFSGRVTDVTDFALTEKITGHINGTVALMGMDGGPEADQNWAGVTVAVEDSPVTVTTFDGNGNFSNTVVVAGTLNVSAAKANFMGDYNDSVTTNATVALTLVEDWDVMVTPAADAMDVALDTTIVAVFDEAVNKSTVNGSFVVKDSTGTLPGILNTSYAYTNDNKTVTLTLPGALDQNTEYSIYIYPTLNTSADMPAVHRTWTTEFTTKTLGADVKGYITDATDDSFIVGAFVSIGAINDTTGTDGMFTLTGVQLGARAVLATADWYMDGELDVTVVLGGIMDQNITLDRVPSGMTSVPADGAVAVAVNTNITVTFANEMANTTTFTVASPTADIAGTITTTDNMTYIFDPTADLEENTTYTVTLAKTLNEFNSTEDWYNWDVTFSFTTLIVPPPVLYITVSNPSPADGATDVALDATLSATFSVPINQTAFKVTVSPTVSGNTSITWSANTFTWTHVEPFANDQIYTVTISKADLLPADEGALRLKDNTYSWDFTTVPGDIDYLVTVSGIKDEDGKPMSGAKATIKVGSKTFDSDVVLGIAIFTIPEADWLGGNWTVTVKKDKYEDLKFDVGFPDTPEHLMETVDEKMEKKEDPGLDMMAIIAIIIVVIIIIILLALAMKPKKPAEEEFEGEEEEEEEEEEDEFECPECGAVVSKGEGVCPECGAEFEEEEFECPECGASVEPGTGACSECGAEFEEEEDEDEEEEDEEFEVEDDEEAEAGEEDEEDEELEDEEELEEEDEEEDEELEDEDLDEEELEEEELEEEELDEEELDEDDEELEEEDEEDEEEEDKKKK